MFSSTAYAQQPGTPAPMPQGPLGAFGPYLPMVMIFFVFYFLLIRPQQKQRKLHQQMISDTKRGDEIITSSGIFGRVTEIGDEFVKVEVDQNVTLKLDKNHIQSIKGYGAAKPAK